MSDDIRKCMDNTRIGFEISSNNLIKNGIYLFIREICSIKFFKSGMSGKK